MYWRRILVVFWLFFLVFFLSYTYGTSRVFPWLEVISREEWWADESIRFFSDGWYNERLAFNNKYELWRAWVWTGKDEWGKFAQKKARDELREKREVFLRANYPHDILTDRIEEKEAGRRLLWPKTYKTAKTKIIIHHTATNTWYETPQQAMSGVQEIYRQHAVSQKRGDIGYNFLIDPLGTLYEGRAGGVGVIAAHADRNNVATIGVSLLGNFNIHEPSLRMWRSLKKLVLALMVQYQIDPMKQTSYFTPINEEPWLEVHTHESLVGHADTKNTACPGEDIIHRLPWLREEMSIMMQTLQERGVNSLGLLRFRQKPITIRATAESEQAIIPFEQRIVRSCKLFGDKIRLEQCASDGTNLFIRVSRQDNDANGRYPLFVETDRGAVWVDVMMVREDDVEQLLSRRQEAHPLQTPPRWTTQKIEHKIELSAVPWLMQRTVGVLLYDATTTLDAWDLHCEWTCAVDVDGDRVEWARQVRVVPSIENPWFLNVFVDLKKYVVSRVRLINTKSVITVTNRKRGSEAYPLNYFKGDIEIRYQEYTSLDKGQQMGWTVVNHLSVSDYLRGVAETIEAQHAEKLRAMALLVKWYIVYYLWWNRHPSVPEGATYQAIDDPRLFQKYVWAGIEQTTPKRQQALSQTSSEIIGYDGYIPILPYFHCSAGFIRSWLERFGWTDTPWLVSKIDLARCPSGDFEWHGVWLSGDGAERLAQAWVSYQDIIRYYYEGVEIHLYR